MHTKVSRRQFLRSSALAIAGATIAACGATPTPTPTKVPPTATKPPAPAATVAAPTATKAAPTATAVPTKAPTKTVIEAIVSRGEHPAQPIKQDAPAHLAITEATGVKLTFQVVPDADYAAKQKVWLATKQVPDLMRAGVGAIKDYVGAGVLMPIMPLVEKHGPNLKRYLDDNRKLGVQKLTVNGELYYVPHQYFNRKVLATMPMIRMDVLKKLGLKEPTDFEELFEVLKAFKKAYPNSAVYTNRSGTERLLYCTAYSMGSGYTSGGLPAYFDKDVDGGKWLYGPIHEEFNYVVDWFARAYKEKLLDPDYAITTADQWHQKNSTDAGLYCFENMSFGVRWNLALRQKDPNAGWGPLHILKGKKGRRMYDYTGLGDSYVIGGNAKYPDRLVQLMDWMITPEGLDITNWGIEGKHYTLKTPRAARVDSYTVPGIEKAIPAAGKELKKDIWDTYAKKTDPFRSYQSDTGTGLLDFDMLTDSTVEYLWDPPGETDEWYALTAKDHADGVIHMPALAPAFTKEENDRLKKLYTDINAIVDPAIEKTIMGQMSMSDYLKEVDKARKAGAEEVEKIYNEAEARSK